VNNGLSRAPASSCQLGNAGRSGLEKDNPETLLFKPRPTVSAQHDAQIGGGVQVGKGVVGNTTQQLCRCADTVDESAQSSLISPCARNQKAQLRVGWRQTSYRLNGDIKSFAWHEPRHAHYELRIVIDAESITSSEPRRIV
jgi:hypothetical protein